MRFPQLMHVSFAGMSLFLLTILKAGRISDFVSTKSKININLAFNFKITVSISIMTKNTIAKGDFVSTRTLIKTIVRVKGMCRLGFTEGPWIVWILRPTK